MSLRPNRLLIKQQVGGYMCSAGSALFDGTNDWLKRSANFTGLVNGSKGIFSLWTTANASNAVTRYFMQNNNGGVNIYRNSAGRVQVDIANGASTFSFAGSTNYGVGAILSPQNFKHIICTWDTNFSAGNKFAQIYLDGVAETLTRTDASAAFNVAYAATEYSIGSDTAGANKWNGSIGCVYFNATESIDLSVPANMAKFRYFDGTNGFPAMMGADGSRPTGTQPVLFLNNDFATFQNNLGSGGGMTLVGALTQSTPASPCIIDTGGGVIE